MSLGSLAVKIPLPAEIAVPLAILGGVVLGTLLVIVLFQKIGKKGTAIIGGVVALYAIISLVVGIRYAGVQEEAASREEARASAAIARIEALTPGTAPLAEACAAIPTMRLEDLVVVFKGSGMLRIVAFRPFQEELHADDESVSTYHPSTLDAWLMMAGQPLSWGERLADTEDFRLMRVKFAVLARDQQAALVDLESDRVICSGSLPEPFQGERTDGYSDMDPKFVKPLVPLCGRIEGDLCAKIQRTADKV